jgi:hypothetical protein
LAQLDHNLLIPIQVIQKEIRFVIQAMQLSLHSNCMPIWRFAPLGGSTLAIVCLYGRY